jgi:uncharacterized protein YbjT (DUF2867 family)
MAKLQMLVLQCLTGFLILVPVRSIVLVTGATGRTGTLLYKLLQQGGQLGETRALVRNPTEAREKLGCKACNASDGVFVGDVTVPSTLASAFNGVSTLAIAVGVHGSEPKSIVEKVEWLGVKNQVQALVKAGAEGKRVLLISTMGTTEPPSKADTNFVMFYKLNAEAFIASTGLPYAIIKPCGLSNDPGNQRELMAGHDDSLFNTGFYMIPRHDVAAVAAAALTAPPVDELRFDLCAKQPGTGPGNAQKVLQEALWPWQASQIEHVLV